MLCRRRLHMPKPSLPALVLCVDVYYGCLHWWHNTAMLVSPLTALQCHADVPIGGITLPCWCPHWRHYSAMLMSPLVALHCHVGVPIDGNTVPCWCPLWWHYTAMLVSPLTALQRHVGVPIDGITVPCWCPHYTVILVSPFVALQCHADVPFGGIKLPCRCPHWRHYSAMLVMGHQWVVALVISFNFNRRSSCLLLALFCVACLLPPCRMLLSL